jgi:two-component system nitrate/nitrite sensor histidine kinase NarX
LYVINPLCNLQQGLQSVQSGDFSTRVAVDTQDEFGQVARSFNVMDAELQTLYSGLEAQVAAKTQHIEAQRAPGHALRDQRVFGQRQFD